MKPKIQFVSDIQIMGFTNFKTNQNARNLVIKIGVMNQKRHSQYMTSFYHRMMLPHLAQTSQNTPHIALKIQIF